MPCVDESKAVFAILGDQRTVRHNPSDLVTDVAEAHELIGRWVQHWRAQGFGYWCVRVAGSPDVVGYCGVKKMTAHGKPVLNLVYRFTPDVWGRGYATEAAAAVVFWVEEHQPDATILARVRPDNEASRNVALKVGLQRDRSLDEPGEDGLDLAYTNRLGRG